MRRAGTPSGFPVILLHGFPDDVRAYDGVRRRSPRPAIACSCPTCAATGRRASSIRPRRGWRSRPRSARTSSTSRTRSQLPRFAVAGYDWGGRAACDRRGACTPSASARAVLDRRLHHPEHVDAGAPGVARGRAARSGISGTSTPSADAPGSKPTAAARAGCLWQTWSPTWRFTDETFDRTAASFDNPDFVDVVIHSYRHRNVNAPGEPRFAQMEEQLAKRPPIAAPAITLYGADDGVGGSPAEATPAERAALPALVAHRLIAGVGHFMPREKPEVVASAILELLR